MKQIIITFIAWTTIVLSVSATGQEGEQLFWKGENYQMLTCPLYDCHAFDNLGKKLEEECSSTSLWRGYIGHWEIENGMLYLSSILYGGRRCPPPPGQQRTNCDAAAQGIHGRGGEIDLM